MKPFPFSEKGKFFKGNLHTRSNRSDGVLEPFDVCEKYKKNGYNFICLSDHLVELYGYPLVDTSAYRTAEFTTLIGAEVHSDQMKNGEIWHLLAVGLPLDFTPPKAPHFKPIPNMESASHLARRCVEAGAFLSIAHPQWSGLTLEDARLIDVAHAVEIYNHGSAVECDRGGGLSILDLLLTEGKKLNLIASDDAHFKQKDYFGGWVMVKAKKNSPDDILESLKKGSFYSSQGPDFFDIEINLKNILIKTSPVASVIVLGRVSAAEAVQGSDLTESIISLDRFYSCDWIRVAIVDSNGRKAWSNPIWDFKY